MVSKAPIVAVVGFSKSGKTVVMEHIISSLTEEGFNVGTIKHIRGPQHSMDVKGKDSWRHSQAGAKIVVCSAPSEIAVFRKRQNSTESIEEALTLMKDENLDLILVEGFRSKVASRRDIHKIVVVKEEREISEAMEENLDPILAFVGPAELALRTRKLGLPFLNLASGGDQLSRLVMNLLA
jgi:molybdopterin-guanine dinucleotide biosynthesis protein MobB